MTADDRLAIRQMRVQQIRWEADGVISVQLVPVDGSEVVPWTPGSHIDVVLPSGTVRQYSLCGDPADRSAYTVAVLRDPQSRGGSRELHDTALVGRTLGVRGPRNHFKLEDAQDYLLIAGGIGITPILTMARELVRRSRSHRLVYGGRSRESMAFRDELERLGTSVDVVPENERGLPDLDALLDSARPGTAVYCCGPEGLIRAVESRCAERGLPVHIERFGTVSAAGGADAPATVTEPEGESFLIELASTGVTVEVPPDRSVLEVVREHVPEVMSTCEEGFCGACETRVIAGEPDHRDTVLDDTERELNETMMICVSRSRSPKLVLDV